MDGIDLGKGWFKMADKKEMKEKTEQTEKAKQIDQTVQSEQVKKKKHVRNDLIVLAVIVILAGAFFAWRLFVPKDPGAEVIVEVSGEEYARYPLNKDLVEDITNGVWYNRLVIQDGVATVSMASCPDKICVHQSDISKNGEMIICLPNQVLITIEGGEDQENDAVVK